MDGEVTLIHAFDYHDAAINFAQQYNADEYALMNETLEIMIVDSEGNKSRWEVSAEPSVHYSADEIEEGS